MLSGFLFSRIFLVSSNSPQDYQMDPLITNKSKDPDPDSQEGKCVMRSKVPLDKFRKTKGFDLEMGPDPTQAYFWPTINKRPSCLWPGYFLIQPKEIFFPKGKIEKFDIFRGNFPNSNPNHKWLTQPGSKSFDPDPSLLRIKQLSVLDPLINQTLEPGINVRTWWDRDFLSQNCQYLLKMNLKNKTDNYE